MIKLSPSILSADFANLARDIARVEKTGAEYLHIDIMDGHFVPNLTFGAPVVKAIRKGSQLVFDVHLMISEPEKYLDDFIAAGADVITVHYESEGIENLGALIERIHAAGIKAAVSLKPATEAKVLFPYLDQLDMVLIMTVEPGFGGQSFIEPMHEKIREMRAEIERRGLSVDIEIDGGVTPENVGRAVRSGANIIVAGSAIFGAEDWDAAVKNFRENAQKG